MRKRRRTEEVAKVSREREGENCKRDRDGESQREREKKREREKGGGEEKGEEKKREREKASQGKLHMAPRDWLAPYTRRIGRVYAMPHTFSQVRGALCGKVFVPRSLVMNHHYHRRVPHHHRHHHRRRRRRRFTPTSLLR
ncbi:hypothetical protein PUN28_014807 [Cardiocondyla obscurior]|uniref:Uncharacterized protein n=1 Tax=Cardiocondyla obscurior TaxID=286306 RepID=A0AAW2EZE5_9HYME